VRADEVHRVGCQTSRFRIRQRSADGAERLDRGLADLRVGVAGRGGELGVEPGLAGVSRQEKRRPDRASGCPALP